MPIQRRLPKGGFKNPTRVEYKAVNVGLLETVAQKFNVTAIDFDLLMEAGLVAKNDLVKVLGKGEIKTALEVTVDAFSASAIAKIEAAGGKAVINK